ncbi:MULTISPECIES: WXG100 family type VII secretion target [unclassified Streptomyces]|uniref:WXG100 family type VII secretion target n=1 Tax=unclassified Streptomyces TaxID=2593676 RepID=UPI00226ECAFE|nr:MULTISPECIES: WXG100 family type VII secretion target [unclassified Streptomyces]MCY0960242.1 WXG100 family type VII secretion target [Streptomyces sp. H27-H5]
MTTYTVKMDQIEYVVGEMAAISKKLQAALSDLDDSAKIHLSEWTSDARSTYDVAKAKWDAAATDMVTQAQNATHSLGHINAAYYAGERHGVSLWEQ